LLTALTYSCTTSTPMVATRAAATNVQNCWSSIGGSKKVFDDLSIAKLELLRSQKQGQIDRFWRVYCSLEDFRFNELGAAQAAAALINDIQRRLARLLLMDVEIATRLSGDLADEVLS
jgi:hypothetical protein